MPIFSSFEDFLDEEGVKIEADAEADKRVLAERVEQLMRVLEHRTASLTRPPSVIPDDA